MQISSQNIFQNKSIESLQQLQLKSHQTKQNLTIEDQIERKIQTNILDESQKIMKHQQ